MPPLSQDKLSENSRILQASYLEKYSNKKDLLRRLHQVVHILQTDETIAVEEEDEWPGLPSLAAWLIQPAHLQHTDKEVRLATLGAAMEVLALYAPEVPWDTRELLRLFRQLIQQLGNLAHTTDPALQPLFRQYASLLESLATVRMGVVLVDLHKSQPTRRRTPIIPDPQDQQDEKEDDEDDEEEDSPLDVLVDLIHTLLHSVRPEHPPEIHEWVQQAIAACLDEYSPDRGVTVPIPILDQLLVAVAQGPTVWTLPAPPISTSASKRAAKSAKDRSQAKSDDSSPAKLPLQIEQPNATYRVAAQLIRSHLNKLATPVSQLLNGLLHNEAHILEQSCLQPSVVDSAMDTDLPTSGNAAAPPGSLLPPPPESTGAPHVYTVIYELHRVAPSLLTTVLGTVAARLHDPGVEARAAVTDLLGRLFQQSPSLARSFRSCYRDWLGRSHDVEVTIRQSVLQAVWHLLDRHMPATTSTPLTNPAVAPPNEALTVLPADMVQEATESMRNLVLTDPTLEVRLAAIHQICNGLYEKVGVPPSPVGTSLLQAVGNRVSAKHKQERRDAVTGLAQIYFRHFVQHQLSPLAGSGPPDSTEDAEPTLDEETLEQALHLLHELCHLDQQRSGRHSSRGRLSWNGSASKPGRSRRRGSNRPSLDGDEPDDDHEGTDGPYEEMYGWIPSKVFECAYFSDQVDSEMRSRVVQLMDEVLLGSDLSSKRKMSPTARAVGLAMILTALERQDGPRSTVLYDLLRSKPSSNASKFLRQLLEQRAKLQQTVSAYIDARAQVREYKAGTEQALAADAVALELLENVAKLTAPVASSNMSTSDVLQAFHNARDKHIFRILASICNPAHSRQARARAGDELPKRTKSLGDAVSDWVRNLVRRCSMGELINVEVVRHCALIARESLVEHDVPACAAMLYCIRTATDIFPSLCAANGTFSLLTDLFTQCRKVTSADTKKELEDLGIVTLVTAILSEAAPFLRENVETIKPTYLATLHDELLQLCTSDGTPEQARNAVYTLSRLYYQAHPGQNSDESNKSQAEVLNSLLKTLTAPSALKISTKEPETIVRTLTSLAALSDCEANLFASSARGTKAIKFATETILLDRGDGAQDRSMDNRDAREGKVDNAASGSKRARRKHSTPKESSSLLEDENLSITCRTICAAIEFLVSLARASVLLALKKRGRNFDSDEVLQEQIKLLFKLLGEIVRDKGLPPSDRDRKRCNSRQDRAALRQCSVIHLLRLCDPRLGLEKKWLSVSHWHQIGNVFLDEEKVVREEVIDELCIYLLGTGIYSKGGVSATAPSLRFLALTVFCVDGEHGTGHDTANGNAANAGKASLVKSAATQCVLNLRRVSDATYAQCRAQGKEAEKKFENHFKMLLMPEYVVPFVFHLLTLRRESPSETSNEAPVKKGGTDDDDDSTDAATDDASLHRMLRKRLKFVFEPLVQTLGDGADNISFLLRMAEILGSHFAPVDINFGYMSNSTSALSSAEDGMNTSSATGLSERTALLQSKLKSIALASREVLLSFVKKDVNLSPFPGIIQLPSFLFTRTKVSSGTKAILKKAPSAAAKGTAKSTVSTPKVKAPAVNNAKNLDRAGNSSRVHFSPEVKLPQPRSSSIATRRSIERFGGVSPIAKSTSPESILQDPGSGEKTLGTTPPSVLRNATLNSTGSGLSHDNEEMMAEPTEEDQTTVESRPRSPLVLAEMRDSQQSDRSGYSTTPFGEEDEGDKTTSETLASQASSGRSSRKRSSTASSTRTSFLPNKEASIDVPDQIRLNARKQTDSTRARNPVDRRGDDMDFGFDGTSGSENEPVTRNRLISGVDEQTKRQSGKRKATTAATNKSVSPRRSQRSKSAR